MSKQRTLRFLDLEKGGQVVTYDADEGHTIRQFIATYHWQHGDKGRGMNAGFLGLYRRQPSEKDDQQEIEWELLPDTSVIGSLDLADDEVLMLKLRPQTIYITMTKPFVVDFNEPLEAIMPQILAGFGETVNADFRSRYCLQRECHVTDQVMEDRGACTISSCSCEDYMPSSIGRKQSGMSDMCRRCGHKSSTHHYRPGPTSYELLDLNKTLSDHSVARNSVVLLKKTAAPNSSSDEIPVKANEHKATPGTIARKISISVDDDSEDEGSDEEAQALKEKHSKNSMGSPHSGRRSVLKRNLSGDGLRHGCISSRQILSPRETDAAKIFNSNGTDIRKWRQKMRSLTRNETRPSQPEDQAAKTRVFGVSLEKLLSREAKELSKEHESVRTPAEGSGESSQDSGSTPETPQADGPLIPNLISSMLAYLETEEALKTEGIFRLSSNYEEVMKFKDQIDRGETVNFSECGAHMAINLLKKFLHELPDSLLPSILYHRYLSAIQGNEEIRRAYMVSLLNSLPQASCALLRRLLVYLRKIVTYTENRMDLHNLATTLAPVLIREQAAHQLSIFSSGSVVLPSRQQHQHRRRASDSAVVMAMANEALKAAKILELLVSSSDEQLFPKEASALSIGQLASDVDSVEGEGAEKFSLHAGDIVFIFQKRDGMLWIEHKSSKRLGRIPESLLDSGLSVLIDEVRLTGKESKALKHALSDDLDEEEGNDEEESVAESEPKYSITRVISEPFKKPKDKEKRKLKKSGDDNVVVERNRLYGMADSLAKPMPLGSSHSATKELNPSPRSPTHGQKDRRKSIGIGTGILTPRKDKKEKKEKKERKEHAKDDVQQHFVNPLLSQSGTFVPRKASS